MENLFLDGTLKTPQVKFNFENEVLILSGRSLPENASEFYNPIKEWIINYFTKKHKQTTFTFDLKYYNTSSSKVILEILNILKDAMKRGQNLKIIWGYEQNDDDAKEDVKDFAEIVGIPIELVVM